MRRGVWITLLFVSVIPQGATAAEQHLNDQQQLGRRLFETSCGVCHTRPTLVSGMYGPELSKDSAGGQEEIMRTVISDGTPRMPGFKYTYNPDQIAAIAAYLKTMPPGTQDLPTARTPPRPAAAPATPAPPPTNTR
jgi:mono/diheme cytochrome c family protein